jgi:hypothetical protein
MDTRAAGLADLAGFAFILAALAALLDRPAAFLAGFNFIFALVLICPSSKHWGTRNL